MDLLHLDDIKITAVFLDQTSVPQLKTVPNLLLNPLMPKRYFCTSIKFIVFKKQTLQGANTDLLNPLVPKAHNSECQNLQFSLQIKPLKVSLKLVCGFLFLPSALKG